jgi:two-component system cell cycle sensor histidine kinase/response regulator CckA
VPANQTIIVKGLWYFLTEPLVSDEDPTSKQKARLLAVIIVVTLPVALLTLVLRLSLQPSFLPDFKFISLGISLNLIPYLLARKGHWRTGSYVFLLIGQCVVTVHIFTDSTSNIRFLEPLVLVLAAALFLELRGTLKFVVLELLLVLALTLTVDRAEKIEAYAFIAFLTFTSTLILLAQHHRNQLEQARAQDLAMREDRQRQLLEAAFDGIAILQGTVLHEANSAFASLLDRKLEDLLGMRLPDLLSEEERPRLQEVLFSTKPWVGEIVIRRPDRTPAYLEAVVSPLRDGHNSRVLFAVRDNTERKELQAGLQIADRMAAVGTLAAGVAHEVNNPLTYVLSNLEEASSKIQAAAKPELEETLQRICTETLQCLSTATEGALRVQRTVQDLNTIARSDQEQIATIHVQEVLDSTITIVMNTLRHKGRLVTDYEEVRPVRADAPRLGQIFLNLLMNACESLDDGKPGENEIRVEVQEDGDNVVVSISDTGAGISKEQIDRIFDPFFTTKPVGVGTGLGLWVCQNLLKDIGGDIQVESEEGVGTTFSIRVPATDQPVQEEAPARPAPTDTGVRYRLLVVDDEPAIAELLGEVLDHHEVHLAHSGTEALNQLRSHRFDLVLCDLMMPDLSGIQVYEASLEEVSGPSPRFVFLTGGAVTETAKRFLSKTHRRVITKPFRPALVRQVISEELAAGAAK